MDHKLIGCLDLQAFRAGPRLEPRHPHRSAAVHHRRREPGQPGGAQMIFPTASRDNMGAGKYRLVPTLGARYNLPEITPGSWAALLLRYDYDFAGESDRRHI